VHPRLLQTAQYRGQALQKVIPFWVVKKDILLQPQEPAVSNWPFEQTGGSHFLVVVFQLKPVKQVVQSELLAVSQTEQPRTRHVTLEQVPLPRSEYG
jgi:hypothetical protein